MAKFIKTPKGATGAPINIDVVHSPETRDYLIEGADDRFCILFLGTDIIWHFDKKSVRDKCYNQILKDNG